MKFPCSVKQLIDGRWQALSLGTIAGNVEVLADTKEAVLSRLRDEIRYKIEWCPCSGYSDDYVELEIDEAAPTRWRNTVF